MQPNLKRILALVATFALLVTILGATVVSAEEDPGYTYTDAYVLTYEGAEGFPESYAQYCKPYLYASPHMSSMAIRDLDTGKMESWICSQQVYNMIDTGKLDQGGEGPYASVEVYCVDACVNAEGGAAYRRINLEDATYFDDNTAGRVRAIFMNSFPYVKDMAVITDAVNSYMESLGEEFTPVSGLTAAEAVTATQYTIWAVANGSDVTPMNPYYYTDDDYTAEYLAEDVVHITDAYMDCTEGERDTTANNIRLLHRYLLALSPMAPQKAVVSEAILTVGDVVKTKEADGTYTMTIPYEVKASVGGDDQLVLTLSCGATRKNMALTAENRSGTLSISGVKASEDVKLEVNGYQTGGDVYLFDSADSRTASQSMVGYNAASLPVHGEVIVESADHILNIYKTTGATEGKLPLANISFDIYKVASFSDIALGKVTISEEPTLDELAAYQTAGNYITTLTTDAAGFATYNFTENGQPDGVYLVVEKSNPAVTAPITPFYVAIPGTTADGTGTVNTVKVYPKNTTESGPIVKKDVTDIDNDHDTFDVDEVHTWIIRGGVPAGMADAVRYDITDTLDYRLTYKGNVRVRVGLATDGAEEEPLVLEETTHYTLTTAVGTDEAGNETDSFVVSLTEAGRKAVAGAVAEGTGKVKDYEVRVYFDAVIDSDAQLGVIIPNQAQLDYTNALGIDYESKSDVPDVCTGGTAILKKNSKDDTLLPGATFRIARDATEEELADETVITESLFIGDSEHTVVFVPFYATADLSGEKVQEVTSDDTGSALIYGLAYGEYYIVETKAPAGFNRLDTPVVVQIDENSHEETEVITVYNSKYALPETGGMGTTVFTAVGFVLLMSAGGWMLIAQKKKKA